FKTPELEKEYEEYAAAWRFRNRDSHLEARKYIFDVWPEFKSADKIQENLEQVRQHMAECKKLGDQLTPRKLRLTCIEQSRLLQQQLTGLRPDREADKKKAETVKAAAEGLRKLLEEVNESIR